MGGSAVEVIVGEQATALRESVIVMGQVIVGAMAASWVNITTSVVLTTAADRVLDEATGEYIVQEKDVLLQASLDGAFPKMLTMLFVLLCWWLMAKKNISPIKVMLLMVVLAFVGVFIGFFDPGLSY